MDHVSLVLQGGGQGLLTPVLLVAIAAILAAVGAYHLIGRRRYEGMLCLLGVLGPGAVGTAMLAVALHRLSRDTAGAFRALGGAVACWALVIVAGVIYLLASAPGLGWMLALGCWTTLAVALFYRTVYAYLGTLRLSALMALRAAAVLALLLILFKPALSFSSAGDSRPYLPVLVDRSASMGSSDAAAQGDRYSQALMQLNFQRRLLERSYQVLWSHFGSSWQMAKSLDDLASLKCDGDGSQQTDIATAIRSAAAQYQRSQLAGLLLVSDGRHNAAADVQAAALQAGVPIYVAGVGSSKPGASGRRNLQIVSVDAPLEVIKNNVATVTVRVRGTSIGALPIECRLVDEATSAVLATDRQSLSAAGDAQFQLKYTPQGPDADAAARRLRKLKVELAAQDGEVELADNASGLHVLLADPQIRVLYIEGAARPEYKFLKRYLDGDPNVRFTGLVQYQAGRFMAQDSSGEHAAALPVTEADFAGYDVIIIGDLDRTYLTNDQLDKLAQFVDKGGGLMMLGGHNSFGPGGYGGTRIEEVMPVIMGGRSQPQETDPFAPQLTAEGDGHAIFEGIAGFFRGPGGRTADAAPRLPDLRGCVTVQGAKPAVASVLAVHPTQRNADGPLVVLAVCNYGRGRCAAFTADTTHLWDMPRRGLGQVTPYQRFWGQMIRYLASTQTKSRPGRTQVLLRTPRTHMETSQAMPLTVRLLAGDSAAASAPAAGSVKVTCTVSQAGGNAAPVTLELSPGADQRLLKGQFSPAREGAYRLQVQATDAGGTVLAADELTVQVLAHASELDQLQRDDETLAAIAAKSGGAYKDLSQLSDLIDLMSQRRRATAPPAAQARDLPLYNFPILFLAFAALLTTEWLLRRNWQLH